ncbi:MAG: T9SS type A sorting domain-containing protein [Bacteroidia bacterium]
MLKNKFFFIPLIFGFSQLFGQYNPLEVRYFHEAFYGDLANHNTLVKNKRLVNGEDSMYFLAKFWGDRKFVDSIKLVSQSDTTIFISNYDSPSGSFHKCGELKQDSNNYELGVRINHTDIFAGKRIQFFEFVNSLKYSTFYFDLNHRVDSIHIDYFLGSSTTYYFFYNGAKKRPDSVQYIVDYGSCGEGALTHSMKYYNSASTTDSILFVNPKGTFEIDQKIVIGHNKDGLVKEISIEHANKTSTVFEYDLELRNSLPKSHDTELNIYPNPSKGIFKLNEIEDDVNLKVLDQNGRIVFKRVNFNSKQPINLHDVNSGIYFILIESEKGQVVKKLIIE